MNFCCHPQRPELLEATAAHADGPARRPEGPEAADADRSVLSAPASRIHRASTCANSSTLSRHSLVGSRFAGTLIAAAGAMGTSGATSLAMLLPFRLLSGAGTAISEAGSSAYSQDLTDRCATRSCPLRHHHLLLLPPSNPQPSTSTPPPPTTCCCCPPLTPAVFVRARVLPPSAAH